MRLIDKIRHDIYPARGRKPSRALVTLTSWSYSPRYLPRKGTETIFSSVILHGVAVVEIRHDIYPARGRKHDWWLKILYIAANSPRYLPRKGTETRLIMQVALKASIFATIFTPQGDGNAGITFAQVGSTAVDSPRYLPRKGTETSGYQGLDKNAKSFATIFTPQGDGNLDICCQTCLHSFYSPRYLPRKGTETRISL